MRNRDWRINLISIVFLIVAIFFAIYLEARQHLAEQRAQNTRAALCAIIDRIPLRVDSGVDKARKLDGCAKTPHPPTVFFGHPFPTPVTVTPTPRPASAPAAPSTPAGGTTPTSPPAPPRPTPTSSPTPTPTPSRSPSRSPSPTPRPSCVHAVVTVCT